MIRNPHTLEDSWWDGPQRFQWVNRNVITLVQHEDLNKFLKFFAPKRLGLDIGGAFWGTTRSTWSNEREPFTIKLNLVDSADVQARAENLPFLDETIGYIVSFHTFEHIKGEPRETLREWLRVLVPGGLMGIVMPDKRHFIHDLAIKEEGAVAYREMEPKEFPELFKDLNAEILFFDSRENNFDFDIVVRKKEKK